MDRIKIAALVSIGLLGCAADAQDTTGGNAELGIVRFAITETADKSTVVGLDDAGAEIGRLDLVHGHYAPTGIFKDEWQLDETNGRKLDVSVGWQKTTFETIGYEPILHMPAHPASFRELTLFLADPHVKPILDRWQLGFDNPVEDAYTQFVSRTTTGIVPADCTGATWCGIESDGINANTCGNSGVPTLAAIRTYHPDGLYGSDPNTYGQYVIDQFCPNSIGSQYGFFGSKDCPTVAKFPYTSCGCIMKKDGSGCESAVSNRDQRWAKPACQACAQYTSLATTWDISINANSAGWSISSGLYSGQPVYNTYSSVSCVNNGDYIGSDSQGRCCSFAACNGYCSTDPC